MKVLRPALTFMIAWLIIFGVLYPGVITIALQLFFPHQANGSLLIRDTKVVGSELLGQHFNQAQYFWSRPSATPQFPYNYGSSSGSNLAITGTVFRTQVMTRRLQLYANNIPPNDLLTSSASGLDPDITLNSAFFQSMRIANARQLPVEEVQTLIETHAKKPLLNVIGTHRVNVLELNMKLDELEQADYGKRTTQS